MKVYLLMDGLILSGRIRSCDVAVDGGAAETMLLATTAGFAACVEAGYDLAPAVDDLRLPVYPQTAE